MYLMYYVVLNDEDQRILYSISDHVSNPKVQYH